MKQTCIEYTLHSIIMCVIIHISINSHGPTATNDRGIM